MGASALLGSASSDEVGHDYSLPHSKTQQDPRSFHWRYELLCKLGTGSFATVYAATPTFRDSDLNANHNAVGKQTAVKIVDLRADAQDWEWRQAGCVNLKRQKSCEKEVAMMRRVTGGDYVVGFVDSFTNSGFCYILMERCDATLWSILAEAPDPTERYLRRFLCEMLQGLAGIHVLGVVHRDVKPDNFMCQGPEATVKLCDFGLAEMLPTEDQPEAGLVGVYGTPPFMAPEMIRGNRYGAKADIWSFGVAVYALFFGRFPYMPAKPDAQAMKAEIRSDKHPPSFRRPRSLCDFADIAPISVEAVSLARTLLRRVPRERPNAKEALRLPFFSKKPNFSQQDQGSLRPVLLAARNIGAFERRCGEADAEKTEMDIELLRLQKSGRVSSNHKAVSSRSTSCGSTFASSSCDFSLAEDFKQKSSPRECCSPI